MKAQEELPQASSQPTFLPTNTDGTPFPRQLDRIKKLSRNTKTVSIITVYIIVLMNIEAVLGEQFSARAHSSTKQQTGRAKCWYVVWCITIPRQKTNKVYFSLTRTASSCISSLFTFLAVRNRKDQRYRVQAGKSISVNGTILRHRVCKGRVWVQTALFTTVIHMARMMMQSTSSSFPAVSQVATPAIYSMKPAALALQPEPSGKELPGEHFWTAGKAQTEQCLVQLALLLGISGCHCPHQETPLLWNQLHQLQR